MKLEVLKCESCLLVFAVDPEEEDVVCPYCQDGYQEQIGEVEIDLKGGE